MQRNAPCRHLLIAGLLGLVAPAVVWSQVATAPEARPETRQALAVLLGSLADGEAIVPGKVPAQTAASPGPTPVRQRVVVRPGETLDGVLRRTLSHLPIKDTVLRAAFVEVNPDAFVNGSAHRLRAGSELQVPSPEDVRRIMLRDAGGTTTQVTVGAAPVAATAQTSKPAEPHAITEAPVPDMRDWVRYP